MKISKELKQAMEDEARLDPLILKPWIKKIQEMEDRAILKSLKNELDTKQNRRVSR